MGCVLHDFSRPFILQEPAKKKRTASQARKENVLTLSVSCDISSIHVGCQISAFLFPILPPWSRGPFHFPAMLSRQLH